MRTLALVILASLLASLCVGVGSADWYSGKEYKLYRGAWTFDDLSSCGQYVQLAGIDNDTYAAEKYRREQKAKFYAYDTAVYIEDCYGEPATQIPHSTGSKSDPGYLEIRMKGSTKTRWIYAVAVPTIGKTEYIDARYYKTLDQSVSVNKEQRTTTETYNLVESNKTKGGQDIDSLYNVMVNYNPEHKRNDSVASGFVRAMSNLTPGNWIIEEMRKPHMSLLDVDGNLFNVILIRANDSDVDQLHKLMSILSPSNNISINLDSVNGSEGRSKPNKNGIELTSITYMLNESATLPGERVLAFILFSDPDKEDRDWIVRSLHVYAKGHENYEAFRHH